jgi:predicted transglutaminase-like cysteine proteinase
MIKFIIKQPAFWIGLFCLGIIAYDLLTILPTSFMEADVFKLTQIFQNQTISNEDLRSGDEAREESFLQIDATLDDLYESVDTLKSNEEQSNNQLNKSQYYSKYFGKGLGMLDNLSNTEKDIASDLNIDFKDDRSAFKLFVTPQESAVKAIAQNKQPQDIYSHAQRQWVWSSDLENWRVYDKWLLPKVFLSEAPKYQQKPLGDCEDQANALASVLRAAGTSPDNVRVALGLVRILDVPDYFNSVLLGGHAWVEYYDNNQWVILEATNGPVYDYGKYLDTPELDFNYFNSYIYPAHNAIAYYNDQFFYQAGTSQEGIPEHWLYYSYK